MDPLAPDALTENPQKAKADLRTRVRLALAVLTDSDRANAAQQASTLLEKQTVWREAHSLLYYAPLAGELDLWRLLTDSLQAGKTVALPRFDQQAQAYTAALITDPARDLRKGRFNVREPAEHCPAVALNRLDFMLVPGVAFDLDGHRLGRGKGFYDRLLAQFEGVACGVAFDEQIVNRIPREPHDARLNCILTPTRWHVVAGGGRF